MRQYSDVLEATAWLGERTNDGASVREGYPSVPRSGAEVPAACRWGLASGSLGDQRDVVDKSAKNFFFKKKGVVLTGERYWTKIGW